MHQTTTKPAPITDRSQVLTLSGLTLLIVVALAMSGTSPKALAEAAREAPDRITSPAPVVVTAERRVQRVRPPVSGSANVNPVRASGRLEGGGGRERGRVFPGPGRVRLALLDLPPPRG